MHERRQFLSLDYIRFFAAFAVMAYHYGHHSWHAPDGAFGIRAAIGAPVRFEALGPWTSLGFLGVEVFFLISGFVIALSAEGRSAFEFFRARAVRLLPAYWSFVLLCLLVTLAYVEGHNGEIIERFARSIVMFPQGPWLDGIYWTLIVEIIFYLFIFVLLLANTFDRIELITFTWSILCFVLLSVALATRLVGATPPALISLAAFVDSYASRPLLISTGPFFALGVAVYGLVRRGTTPWRLAFAAVAAAGGGIAVFFTSGSLGGVSVWALATGGTIWLIFFEAGRAVRPVASWQARLARVIGLAAYPLYLVHNIIGAWVLGRLITFGWSPYLALIGAATFSIGLSLAFAAFVEPELQRNLRRGIDGAHTRVQTFLATVSRHR